MSQIHSCTISTFVEAIIFTHDKITIPDEDCPICIVPLKEKSPYGCQCGSYAKRLTCGHWVHVSCQIDRNPDRSNCPICRADVYKLGREQILKKQQDK